MFWKKKEKPEMADVEETQTAETPAAVETSETEKLSLEQQIDLHNQQVQALHSEIGKLRQNYLAQEGQLVRLSSEAQGALTKAVEAFAQEKDVDLSTQRWNFNIDKKEFTPVE